MNSSANVDLIPADDAIADQISALHVGNVVQIECRLVNIKSFDNWRMTSSLTRLDSGAGACEIYLGRKFNHCDVISWV